MEIEKKFTIKNIPFSLASYEYRLIEQAYLNTAPVIRIRKEDENYYLTYKGAGLLAREEYNLPLNKEAYYHLLKKADGNVISKKRYLIPIESSIKLHTDESHSAKELAPRQERLLIELDIFDPPFAPLIIAEVEFPDLESAEAFHPPEWFLEDVTMDRRYHNSNLSREQF